ncbi:MAG: hypothetical protein NHB14_12825 [Desulfosporosinus sp.]|nr:hypothetical protein [Desulfosporosinus sp.]
MKNKERILWISSMVIILAVSLIIIFQYQIKLSNAKEKKTSLFNDNSQLQQENEDCATQASGLRRELEKLELGNYDKTTMLKLQAKGYTGQLKDIVADLKMQSELIPYKGIMGGTMGFYHDKDIHVLTDRWALAYFDDGHISGYMLLSYDINNGTISWKVIDSHLDV